MGKSVIGFLISFWLLGCSTITGYSDRELSSLDPNVSFEKCTEMLFEGQFILEVNKINNHSLEYRFKPSPGTNTTQNFMTGKILVINNFFGFGDKVKIIFNQEWIYQSQIFETTMRKEFIDNKVRGICDEDKILGSMIKLSTDSPFGDYRIFPLRYEGDVGNITINVHKKTNGSLSFVDDDSKKEMLAAKKIIAESNDSQLKYEIKANPDHPYLDRTISHLYIFSISAVIWDAVSDFRDEVANE